MKPVLAMARPSAGIRATFGRPVSARSATRVRVADLGEQTEVLELGRRSTMSPVSSRRRASTGPEPVEEEVQVAERGAEQLRAGHAELGVTPHHREVGHQRELERTAERVRLDLRDR